MIRTKWKEMDGKNGENRWPGRITMDPRAPYVQAVWAQEFYEARRQIRRPWEPIIRVLTWPFPKLDYFGRDMELMGHEIEVQAAVRHYGLSHYVHRGREANVLTKYRQFKGWSAADIATEMMKRSAAAKHFVTTHWTRIMEEGTPP